MSRFVNAAILSAALVTSVAMSPAVLRAQDQDRDHDHGVVVYQDKAHHDKHEWNEREERAYRMYWTDQHHEYRQFTALNPRAQQEYWEWRHHHSDADLHIDIH
jgi:hypothetical protein